jgi:putative GTP pyrophosphokinase
MSTIPLVSNSRADRAGEAFRDWAAKNWAGRDAPLEEVLAEVSVIRQYRAMHAYPLRKVTSGVRVMLETELDDRAPRPAQRFKRVDRILSKLVRFPHMRLSQVEDIGGCRAVLETLDDVHAAATRMRHRWTHARVHDHISNPKPDGYRALHIIERRDDRLIEVQLRTVRQHYWAELVEIWAGRLGYALKDGRGPDDLRMYFAMAAERLAQEDRNESKDEVLEREFATLRNRVRHYFASPSRS